MGGVRFFGTFFRRNHNKGLDIFRVLYDAKENYDSFLEMTHPEHNVRGSVLKSIPGRQGEGVTTTH